MGAGLASMEVGTGTLDIGFSAVVSLVDDVCVVFPDTVVVGAGLRGARLPGVW